MVTIVKLLPVVVRKLHYTSTQIHALIHNKFHVISTVEDVYFKKLVDDLEEGMSVNGDTITSDGVALKGRGIVCSVVSEIRARIGVCKKTEANRLMLVKMASDVMVNRGMRPTHIQKYIPLIVILCMMPTTDDIFARKFGNSSVYLNRVDDYQRGWHQSWWARLRGLPAPEDC